MEKYEGWIYTLLGIRHSVSAWGDRMTDVSEWWRLGRENRDQGDLNQAIHYYELALKRSEDYSQEEERQDILNELGLVYLDLGANTISTPRIEKGISCLKISWSIADRRGDVPGAAMSLVNMGIGYYRLRKLDEAMQSLDWGLRMLRELGDRSSAGQALSYVGRVHVAAGRLDEAIDTLRESVTILHEVGARLGEAEALDGLGRVYLELKRYDEALGAIEQSRTIYRQDGDRRGEALSTLQIGVTYLRAGNKAAARDNIQPAVAALEELGAPEVGKARATLNMVDVYP